MMRGLVFLLALAACSDPPLALRFRVTSKPGGACYNTAGMKLTTCSDVTMMCHAVVSIRIFNPNDSLAPYISVCKELTGQPNLCSIAGVDLPQPTQQVNEQTLAVEMVVFPFDPSMKDPVTGELTCPTGVQFDADGFPIAAVEPCIAGMACPPTPAIGGIAYYHPGDAETVVDLGCTDLTQLNNAMCSNLNQIPVTATVSDFDTGVSVQPSLGDRLSVYLGEPTAMVDAGTHYSLSPLIVLARTKEGPIPFWGDSVDNTFVEDVCLGVLEDAAQTTATVTCQPFNSKLKTLEMTGMRLAKSTLTQVLGAISEPAFPEQGLVVGIVLDSLGDPVEGANVSATGGSIVYLSSDRQNIITGGTSSNGIFVSQDAPFKTTFSYSAGLQSAVGLGGLVDNKVTVVVLKLATPIGN